MRAGNGCKFAVRGQVGLRLLPDLRGEISGGDGETTDKIPGVEGAREKGRSDTGIETIMKTVLDAPVDFSTDEEAIHSQRIRVLEKRKADLQVEDGDAIADDSRPHFRPASLDIMESDTLKIHQFYADVITVARESAGSFAADSEAEAYERKQGDFHLTDLGNAERFALLNQDCCRFCPPVKRWFVWDGRQWNGDALRNVGIRAAKTVRLIHLESMAADDKNERRKISDHALRSEAAARISAMLELAPAIDNMVIAPSCLDADPYQLNCQNGILGLRAGKLSPHRREAMLSHLAPVEYHPEATSDLWENFLRDATNGDGELEAFLQRACGYSLTGSAEEEVLFFVHGPGAAGKSTFLETIKAAFGDYAEAVDIETLMKRTNTGGPRPEIARLEGRRLAITTETSKGAHLSAGLVKQLTGGDTVIARQLYSEAREFKPQCKFWLVGNFAPVVDADDTALWRRILRLPFENVIPGGSRNTKLKAELRKPEHLQAVLAWAVRGCLEWQKLEGLKPPETVLVATRQYRQDSDRLSPFFTECCILQPMAWTATKVLRDEYEEWCNERGDRPFGSRALTDWLKARDCRPERLAGELRGWRGIGLLSERDKT